MLERLDAGAENASGSRSGSMSLTADTSLPADTFARVMRSFGWGAYFDAVSKPPPMVVARAIARLSARPGLHASALPHRLGF
jgi:hypothetical protein